MSTRSSLLVFLAVAASVHAAPKYGNNEAITADRLRAHLEFIASDDLEGRNTPSRGLDIAAKYIAANLKLWGVQPAGDNGTYFQTILLHRAAVSAEATACRIGDKPLKYGDDFFAQKNAGAASGAVVYVGYGWVVPGKADPYKNVDVKGKILLALSGEPRGLSGEERANKDTQDIQEAARARGAVGIVFVATSAMIDFWEERVQSSTRPNFPAMDLSPPSAPALPSITLAAAALDELLQGESLGSKELIEREKPALDREPFQLKRPVSVTVTVSDDALRTQNVVAMVEGTDKALKAEWVAFGAHYDHVGMRTSGEGDGIFNGADDDGSGTVAIMEIAHAFAVGPKPKRSVIFVWHAGEEKGLWGSRYFTEKPTVPLDKIVAQLNIDMIGRSKKEGDTNQRNARLTGPSESYIVGSRRLSKELGDICEQVNKDLLKLTYNYRYDQPNDPENIYQRSDHYNYARKGIPIAFWFDGEHEDYHGVGDEPQKIDYVKMEMVTRTVYATGWTVANRKDRLKLDKPAGG